MAEKTNTKPFYNFQIPIDWKLDRLSEYGTTYTGLSGKTKDDFGHGKPYIPYLNIFKYAIIKDGEFDYVNVNGNEKQSLVENGDLLFTTSSETPEEVGMCSAYDGNEKVLYLNSFSFGFRPKNKNEISSPFVALLFRSEVGRRVIYKLAQGATRYNISKTNLLKELLPLPSLPEQKAIAHILGLIETAINKNNQLIEQKELKRKWIGRHLLNGKLRITEFIKETQFHRTGIGELPLDWKINSVENILTPVRRPFVPDKNEQYQEIGIRSHTKGLFHKEKVNGSILGNKRVFWIEPNCFIVNIVFAWEHAIAKTTEKETGMIASHRFPMFKPKKGIVNLDYLLYYFSSPRGKHSLGLASPGGAGRNKTLGQTEFLKLQIPIPTYDEQNAIAQILQAADKEIQLLKSKTEKLKEKKKGLMQQLLTGKKRLKIKIN